MVLASSSDWIRSLPAESEHRGEYSDRAESPPVPELPELQALAEGLATAVPVGRSRGSRVWQPAALKTAEPPLDALAGRTRRTDVWRRGKLIGLATGRPDAASIHLMQGGRLGLAETAARSDPAGTVALSLVLEGGEELRLRELRHGAPGERPPARRRWPCGASSAGSPGPGAGGPRLGCDWRERSGDRDRPACTPRFATVTGWRASAAPTRATSCGRRASRPSPAPTRLRRRGVAIAWRGGRHRPRPGACARTRTDHHQPAGPRATASRSSTGTAGEPVPALRTHAGARVVRRLRARLLPGLPDRRSRACRPATSRFLR